MGTRCTAAAGTLVGTVLVLTGCSGKEDPGLGPDPTVTTATAAATQTTATTATPSSTTTTAVPATATTTTAATPAPTPTASGESARCAARIPDAVFTTLAWTPTEEGATATVRGCHREATQGYLEVRDRSGYQRLCRTLDRSGGVRPGVPVDWLGKDVAACAVEPTRDVGQTKVVVRGKGGDVTEIKVVVLTSTSRDRVRAAVALLVG